MGPHDSAYKLLFSHPYLVECLLRGFIPGPWIRGLDFASLETVREAHPRDSLGMRSNDMIWRLRWRDSSSWVYLYLMLEFQSTDEPFMAVRALDYSAGLYRHLVKLLQPSRSDKLPIVLPVVIYRGATTWGSKAEVFELIAPAPEEVEPYLPHLRFLLLDINAFSTAQLEVMRNPVACLMWLEASQRVDTAPIDELVLLLSSAEHNELKLAFKQWLTRVFLPSRFPGVTVPEIKNLEEVSPMINENAINWFQPMQEEAIREGRRKGLREGKREGRLVGRQEGRQEGLLEGQIVMLLRMLGGRFGTLEPTIEERVRNATSEDLVTWADRFATASSLDDVFAD